MLRAHYLIVTCAIASCLLTRCMPTNFEASSHSDNWAVIACTSSYWFNYRHLSNALSVYYIIRRMGIPDNQIILMNSMDPVCDARNPYPGRLFNSLEMNVEMNKIKRAEYNQSHKLDIGVEVDYRGDEVSVDSFLRVLTGRHTICTPSSKILQSGNESNVLIFLSGHGGDEFFKFRDSEEMSADDIGYAIKEMELKGRYREILLIVDTCQASTLASKIASPRVIAIGSSAKGENSYGHVTVSALGVSAIDRFSHMMSKYFYQHGGIISGNANAAFKFYISKGEMKKKKKNLSQLTLQGLLEFMDPSFLYSTVTVSSTEGARNPKNILLQDFFGMVTPDFKILNQQPYTIFENNGESMESWEEEYAQFENDNSDLIDVENLDQYVTANADSASNQIGGDLFDELCSDKKQKTSSEKNMLSPFTSSILYFIFIVLFLSLLGTILDCVYK